MTREALRRRAAERERLLRVANTYVRALAWEIGPCQAWVVGSVARGDFHDASDIDVVVVSDRLPADPLDRLALLHRHALPRVEAKGYTTEEWETERRRGNPMVVEALSAGIPLQSCDGTQ